MGYQDMATRARTLLTKHQINEDLLYWPEYPDPAWVIPSVESLSTRDEIVGRSLVVYQKKVEQCLVQLDNIGWLRYINLKNSNKTDYSWLFVL